jgi:large subunit ribosomal protein L31
MKKDIHPRWYPNAQVICSCGATYTMGATQEVIRTDVCSACHPFFTGEQRIVDTEGQVERFMRRLERREELLTVEEKRRTKKVRRREKRSIVEIVDQTGEEATSKEETTAEVAG